MCRNFQTRYNNDPKFRQLTDMLTTLLIDSEFNMVELDAAVKIAKYGYSNHTAHLYNVPNPPIIVHFTKDDVENGKLIIKIPKKEFNGTECPILKIYDNKHNEMNMICECCKYPIKYVRTDDGENYVYQLPFSKDITGSWEFVLFQRKHIDSE